MTILIELYRFDGFAGVDEAVLWGNGIVDGVDVDIGEADFGFVDRLP